MSRPGFWISSNFTNRSGFAWQAFFRSFRRIADDVYRDGWQPVLSFAEIDGEVDILSPKTGNRYFVYDPLNLSIAQLANLRRGIKQHQISVAYLTDLPSWHWTYPLMRWWGVRRIVVHSHISVASPYPAPPSTGLRGALKGFIQNRPWLRADEVLTCSNFVKHRLVASARYPESSITVLPYGLPETRFETSSYSGAASDVVRISCASRAVEEKGVGHLIEAVALLAKRPDIPPHEVSFAGTGPKLDHFKSMARSLGVDDRFNFLGYVDGTTALLEESDVVVIPSAWGDAFPYSVLEALAAGRAVIGTSAGGIPEQIGPSGEAGLLVEPRDPEALATALEQVIRSSELRARLAANARARAAELFREDRYFDELSASLTESVGAVA